MHRARLLPLIALPCFVLACASEDLEPLTFTSPADIAFASEGAALTASLTEGPGGFVTVPMSAGTGGFDRIGFMFDDETSPGVEARASHDGGYSWSAWQPATITWREEKGHNGHADFAPGATHAQLRFDTQRPETLTYLAVELFEYEPEPTLPEREEGLEVEESPYASMAQGLAADGYAVLRGSWGSRSTSCSSRHTPAKITIHHTVTPNNDSWDMPRRMRQMQAYHMDSRGYCDIGYHFTVGQDGKIYQGRIENRLGAHVANNNTNNMGISFIGTYTSVAPSSTMMAGAARMLKRATGYYKISLDRTRVKGHREYAATACPGGSLYSKMGALVTLAQGSSGTTPTPTPTPTKGVLKGAVFWGTNFDTDVSDTSKRLSGATVKLSNGATATTDASGYYTFEVAAGTYTATASKSGYTSASTSKSVTSGSTTWGSIMLAKQTTTTTGTVKGYVFSGKSAADFAANSQDPSKRIPNATVTFSPGGKTAKTNTDGYYQLALAPGSYSVRAAATGYQEATRPDPVSVTTGGTSWGSTMVLEPAPTDTTPPRIDIAAPSDGATLDLAQVQVVGTVSDQSAIASFTVAGKPAPVQNGGFSVAVALLAGENELVVEAVDAMGLRGSATVRVTYAPPPSGIEGFVHDAADPAVRIPGALVRLEGEGQSVEARTDDAGAFLLDAEPGALSLIVSAEGFATVTESLTVAEGVRHRLQIGLHPGEEETASSIEITFPLEGDLLAEPSVLVTGSAHVEGLTRVSVNGADAALHPESGAFTARVALAVGENQLEVMAWVDESEAVRRTVTVQHAPQGGCSVAGGSAGPFSALLLLGLLLRRRR